MFGGITIFNENLNLNIYKEILVLVMGPLTQVLFLTLVYYLYTLGLVNPLTYSKFKMINIILLKFNLLPILPLDGGKLLNNILDLILPYTISNKVSIILSFIFIPFIFTYDNKLIVILIVLNLTLNLITELNNINLKTNKLLLERKLKHIKFNKKKQYKSINKIKRNVTYYKTIDNRVVYDYEDEFIT